MIIWGRFGMVANVSYSDYQKFIENPKEMVLEFLERGLFKFSGETYFPEGADDNPVDYDIEFDL